MQVAPARPSFQGFDMSFDVRSTSSPMGPATSDDEVPSDLVGRSGPRLAPVAAGDRLFAVDVLRGFALLGILTMNIVGFAWPGAAYSDPTRAGGGPVDLAAWFF